MVKRFIKNQFFTLIDHQLQTAWKDWSVFWFESHNLERIKIFRFLVGAVLFCSALGRTNDLEMFYSDHGLVPLQMLSEIISPAFRISLLTLFKSDLAVWCLHGVLLASLVTLAFGLFPRFSAAIAFVVHVSFIHRNPSIVYGVDNIGVFFLFYLTLIDLKAASPSAKAVSSMAFRLCQVQVCVIYIFSGLSKLKGMHWWSGDALWHVLANTQIARFDFTWVGHFPTVIRILSYVTVVWEIYFVCLIWSRFRRVTLLIGFLMHIAIAITVNIPLFSALMIASYVLFLEPAEMKGLFSGLKYYGLCPKRIMSRLEDFGG